MVESLIYPKVITYSVFKIILTQYVEPLPENFIATRILTNDKGNDSTFKEV